MEPPQPSTLFQTPPLVVSCARPQRSLHVCNAPSPAATSAIPIGQYLRDQAIDLFGLGH